MSSKRRHRHHSKPVSFDPVAGEAAKTEGATQALTSAVAVPWRTLAQQWYDSRSEPFTSDDIIAAIGLPFGGVALKRNNAVGAFFLTLSRRKEIEPIGYRASDRKESHRHANRVWVKVA